jgi:hypothetical protein
MGGGLCAKDYKDKPIGPFLMGILIYGISRLFILFFFFILNGILPPDNEKLKFIKMALAIFIKML